jgi:hypothetical protein
MNDVSMEEEVEESLNVQIGNPIVETKGSRNEVKETKEVMKINLKKLHVRKIF